MRERKSVKLFKTEFSGSDVALRSLLSVDMLTPGHLEFGAAVMARGCRQPRQGVSCHDGDEISLLLTGRAIVETESGRVEIKSGDIVLIKAGEAHATEALEDCHVYYVLTKSGVAGG
jgi:quercetin dioxygenase-like cupin family protein